MKRFYKRIAVLLCMILVSPMILDCLPSTYTLTKVEAAEKKSAPKVILSNKNVGVSSSPEYIYVENFKEEATYTYTSSDKKIATVDEYGYIRGISTGKAKITIYETIKDKKTKLGTYSITVVKAQLTEKEIEAGIGNMIWVPLNYMNFEAQYNFKSSNAKIVAVNEYGELIAKKIGEATITVTENYKKKNVDIGSFKVKVANSSIHPEYKAIDIGLNNVLDLESYIIIQNRSWGANYTFESSDSNIVLIEHEDTEWGSYYNLIGNNLGTATVTVYEKLEGSKKNRKVGTVDVTVKDIPVTEFSIDPSFLEEDGNYMYSVYMGSTYDNVKSVLVIEPFNASTPITFVSSDEAILTVDEDGNITPISEGSAEVTINCGKFEQKIKINVISY